MYICIVTYASHNVARMGCRPPTPTLRAISSPLGLSYRLLLVAEVELLVMVCARTLAHAELFASSLISLSANSSQIREEISWT